MDTNDTDANEDIQQVPSSTPDFKTELAKKLQELAPEAIADGKVDTKKLKELLDDDATDDSERFGLFWPGKKRAMRAAQEPTTATLKPAKKESKDWDTTQNIFIEGDNLEVLKLLQKHYHNKIKMIYIDPPYNTGKDFVYPDNYKEGLQSYLEFTKQVDEGGKKVGTNTDTDGRYHSNWLNMMYPRLKLARNLLTEDGVIFISIDDHEQDNLKKLCDEIFGENNFLANAVWNSSNQIMKQTKTIRKDHEYLLCYAKHTGIEFNKLENSMSFSNPDNDPRGAWFSSNAKAGGKYEFEIQLPGGNIAKAKWNFSKEDYENGTVGVYLNGNNVPRRKVYENEYDKNTAVQSSILTSDNGTTTTGINDAKNLFNGESYFDNPKPVKLINRLLTIATHKDSIILDFFSGSGTTAHAIMLLNAEDEGDRNHIQVQLPEPTDEKSEAYKAGYKTIADIAKERIRRAGEKIKSDYADKLKKRENPLDVGFKVYKLADSNFSKWHTSSSEDVDSVQQRLLDMRESSDDNATQEDLLTEILLKLGLSLTAKATQKQIAGLPVWDVNDGTILAYLDEQTKPNLDQLRAIANTEPAKFVILEDAFQGDDELKTNLSQICKTNKIDLWTV